MTTDLAILAELCRQALAGDASVLPPLCDLMRDLGSPARGKVCSGRLARTTQQGLRSVLLWATDRAAWDAREARRKAVMGTAALLR